MPMAFVVECLVRACRFYRNVSRRKHATNHNSGSLWSRHASCEAHGKAALGVVIQGQVLHLLQASSAAQGAHCR